jgi:hypothetical protein
MPPTTYNYTISVDFPNQEVNATALETSIGYDPAITIALSHIDCNIAPDICAITFDDALPVPDKAALDALVAAHQGVLVVSLMEASLPVGAIGDQSVDVTQDLVWQSIDLCVTRPGFFSPNMADLIGPVNGCYASVGGGELRIIEEGNGLAPEEKINPPFVFPDTAGAMVVFVTQTNVPPRVGADPSLPNMYRIEARLNGATSLSFKAINFSIVNFKVVPGVKP